MNFLRQIRIKECVLQKEVCEKKKKFLQSKFLEPLFKEHSHRVLDFPVYCLQNRRVVQRTWHRHKKTIRIDSYSVRRSQRSYSN